MSETKLIAHGGFPAKYPESSLEGILAAVEFKPHAIETDVFLHPDTDELICFRPTGLTSTQGTFTAENISAQLAAGAAYVKLSEVIAHVSDKSLLLLDFKQPSAEVFSKLFDGGIDTEQIIVGVRNLTDLQTIHQQDPTVKTLALFSDSDSYAEFQQQGGTHFRLWQKDVTPERVAAIHALGLQAWVTPGEKATEGQPRTAGEADADTLRWLASMAVNGVLVNDIETATQVLVD